MVPAFESANKLPPSLSKQDLIKLWEADTIQPFYYKACWKCQRHLDYDAWRRYKQFELIAVHNLAVFLSN